MEIVKNGFVLKTNQSLLSCLVRLEIKVWFINLHLVMLKRPISAMVCGIKTFSNKSTFTFMALTDENNISRSFINQDIGKTVFLTEEEAEKALEGINHD